jgi:hypothetical protein
MAVPQNLNGRSAKSQRPFCKKPVSPAQIKCSSGAIEQGSFPRKNRVHSTLKAPSGTLETFFAVLPKTIRKIFGNLGEKA